MNRDALDQLITLTANWNTHTLVPDAEKNKAVEIGKALNKAGGMRLMQDIYYRVKARNRYAGVLAAYWDGIGEWRW